MSDFRKIRVLHIITRFLKWGGADKNTYDSIQALDPKHYSVDLVVGREAHLELLQNYDHGQVIQLTSLVRNPNPVLDLVTLVKLLRLIKQSNYDIVHTHTGKAGVLGRLAGRLAKTPVIIHSLHGTMTSSTPIFAWLYRQFDKALGAHTDYFVSVGQDLKCRYLQHHIGEPSKYHIIRSGMDLGEFQATAKMSNEAVKKKRAELGLREDAIIIGKVARLRREKGYHYALLAAKQLIQLYNNLQFVFVGEGNHETWLRDSIRKLGLEHHIVLVGYRSDIAEVIKTFDIFLFASLREGLPQVLVQAALVEKPIVTFAVDGACEVVVDGISGYVVPVGDVNRLVNQLKWLIDNPDKAHQMGVAGKDVVGKQWSTEIMMEKTRAFYEKVAREGKM